MQRPSFVAFLLLAASIASAQAPDSTPDRDRDLAGKLAAGDAALRRGDAAAAAAILEPVAAADWPCRGIALLARSRALLDSGRPEDALAAAELGRSLAPAHAIEAAWARAQALRALGRPEAGDALLALAKDDDLDAQRRGQALVEAAESYQAAQRFGDAAKTWRRAALEAAAQAPLDALDRARAAGVKAGEPSLPLSAAQRLALAKALRDARLHERAILAFKAAEKGLSGPALAQAKLLEARSHYDLRQNVEARAAAAEVVRLVPGTEAAGEARLISARAAWRDDESAAVLAQAHAALADTRLRKYPARSDTRLLLGNFHLEKGRLDEAVAAFQQLLAESPSSSKAGEARWRIAWCRLLQHRPADAATEFEKLAKEQAGTELERVGALWAALSRERAGQDATPALLDVAERWPWTYQGAQSRRLLAERLKPEELAQRSAEWDAAGVAFVDPGAPSLTGDAGTRYVLLRDAGLHEWALPEIEALAPAKGRTDAQAYELAKERARAGHAGEAEALLRARFPQAVQQPSRKSPPEFWEVVYPLPLRDVVVDASSRHDLNPALCAAIIRSESGWDPTARSWADARGLMQLLPKTALPLAQQEGLAGFDAAQLEDPAINVALGARHLSALLALFKGEVDPAIAAYNAGEDKVASWWADFDREGLPDAERVERIPYRETRQYVRRVREAAGWYAWLLGCAEPGA